MTDKPEDAARPVKKVPCEVYSRIVGYLRPVQDWNEGKKQEFAERKAYNVQEAVDQVEAEKPRPKDGEEVP